MTGASEMSLSVFCFCRFIANAGDARAVLGVQEEDGSFTAHTLSNDHNAQNEEEVTRIRGEHPSTERKTVIRQVHSLMIVVGVLSLGIKNMFAPSSPGAVARPPHAISCFWGRKVQMEHRAAEARAGVWARSAP